MAKVKVRLPSGKVKEVQISDLRPYSWYDAIQIKADLKSNNYVLFKKTGSPLILSNMKTPSSIPNGFQFELQAVRISYVGVASADDLNKLIHNAVLIYRKGGSDEIFVKPLWEFTTGGGVWTPKADVDVPSFGLPTVTAVSKLPFSIFIDGGDVMEWIIAVDFQFPPTDGKYLSQDITLQVVLDGVLKKPAL
jgi:hypothetical protein